MSGGSDELSKAVRDAVRTGDPQAHWDVKRLFSRSAFCVPGRRDERDETREEPPPAFTSGDFFATFTRSLSSSIGIITRERETIHAYLSPEALFAQWPQDTPYIELSGSELLLAARAHGNRAVVVCASPDLELRLEVDELAAAIPPAKEDIFSRLGSVPGAVAVSMAEMDAGGPQLDAYGRVFKTLESFPEIAGGHLSVERTASGGEPAPSPRRRRGLFRISIEREVQAPPRRERLLLAVKFRPEVGVERAGQILREIEERIREVMGMRFGGEIAVYRDDTLPDSLPPQAGPPGGPEGPAPPREPLPWS